VATTAELVSVLGVFDLIDISDSKRSPPALLAPIAKTIAAPVEVFYVSGEFPFAFGASYCAVLVGVFRHTPH
jgi:hypothetical protein